MSGYEKRGTSCCVQVGVAVGIIIIHGFCVCSEQYYFIQE